MSKDIGNFKILNDQNIFSYQLRLNIFCDFWDTTMLCFAFQRLSELQEEHNMAVSRLITALEREKEDSSQLKSSLTSMTGDKQVIKLAELE